MLVLASRLLVPEHADMEEEVKHKLIALNQVFYRQFARPFAETRSRPQPGFQRLLDFIVPQDVNLLDVGCGEGRFGRFVIANRPDIAITGVDFTEELLSIARSSLRGNFLGRDLGQSGCLEGLGKFDVVVCLATLQHIPGRDSRIQLLTEICSHLAKGGRVLMSNWQFLASERQRRKILDWSVAGLSLKDVEPNDWLISWGRDGFGYRYVSHIDEGETRQLARVAGLRIIDQFRSDGREGDLNLYTEMVVDQEAST